MTDFVGPLNDIYHQAAEYLAHNYWKTDAVEDAWQDPESEKGGALFLYCSPTGRSSGIQSGQDVCGCLTQVHVGVYPAYTESLADEIRKDDRLHNYSDELEEQLLQASTYIERRELLEPYAEWQRKMDQMWPGRLRDRKRIDYDD